MSLVHAQLGFSGNVDSATLSCVGRVIHEVPERSDGILTAVDYVNLGGSVICGAGLSFRSLAAVVS